MYKTRRKLPSSHVTLDLLRDIEDYATRTAREFGAEVDNEDNIWSYWLFRERTGEMRRKTISDFRGEYLDNATQSIRFHFECKGDVGCEVDVSLEQSQANLTVSAWGVPEERDKAVGIAEAIRNRFSQVSNKNSIFHYHGAFGLVALLILLFVGGVSGKLLESSQVLQRLFITYIATTGFVWLYLAIGSIHLPYSQFATRRNESRAARFWKLNWVFVGSLLGTLVIIFRNYIW